MANRYTKETVKQGDSEVVRYKNGTEYVPTNKVPTGVVKALEHQKDGAVVDELGDSIETYKGQPINTDESADEPAPGAENTPQDDTSDDDEEDPTPPAAPAQPATAKPRTARRTGNPDIDNADDTSNVPQDEDDLGMGFKRVKGKTVDIFDGKTPHTHVRNVNGLMVPLSQVHAVGDPKNDVEPKSDAEIVTKLKELGKL